MAGSHLQSFPSQQSAPKPIAFVLFWSVMVGLFMAFYMLMIGYVNRDARRRGMSPAFWTVIMIFLLASGIGFIVYFLLREPLVLNCPKCDEKVDDNFQFFVPAAITS